MKPEFKKKFLTDTDHTGRFIVYGMRTGRTYFVEALDDGSVRSDWGSIDPATKTLMNKKGHDKYKGAVHPDESLITKENGFDKIHLLEPGMSPHAYIEYLDKQYPDKAAVTAEEVVCS